jgi:hypothetical protein
LEIGRAAVTLERERSERIAELEARTRPRRVWGVSRLTTLVAAGAAAAFLWLQRADLQYFVSDSTPITLGSEGDYHFDSLRSNRYAQLHATPTLRGAYAREGGTVFVLLGAQGTPVLVRREALPTEAWAPGQVPPRPDPRPFAVRGRVLMDQDAERYRDGFDKLRAWGEVVPRDGHLWILVEGERPRGLRDLLWTAVSAALLALVVGFYWVRARPKG